MRINWFSPLLPQRTDIAHYTARLAPELAKWFDVTFWTEEEPDSRWIPAGARVRVYDRSTLANAEIRRELFAGINLYNMGNNADYHHGVSLALREAPGIVICHDTYLHHFFLERSRSDDPPCQGYLELAERLYGTVGAKRARAIVDRQAEVEAHIKDMPFLEPVVDSALGVIVHSRAAGDQIRRLTTTPILIAPLPFDRLSGPSAADRTWAAPWRFVLFGFLNTNRRVPSVLEALSRWSRRDFRLDIFGSLWDPPKVGQLIKDLGLVEQVGLHGFVSEDVLDEAIARAHLSFNLRSPTMGEASGAILRSWSHATPAVATELGWYAGLPDEVAPKVSAAAEIDDIVTILDALVGRPERFEAMGRAGQRRLRKLHSPQHYVRGLTGALEKGGELMIRAAARGTLRRLGEAVPSRREREALLGPALSHLTSALFGRPLI